MSAKQTKQQREKRVKEVNKFLSETKASAAEVSYPTVPFEVSPLARTRAEFIALIAALLRPRAGDASEAVIGAFELIELAEGGKRTLQQRRKDGGTPGYDEGVREAFLYRQAELERFLDYRKTASFFIDCRGRNGELDLDAALGKIFPHDKRSRRAELFEDYVARLFQLERSDLEPCFKEWREGKQESQGMLPVLLRRALIDLPLYRATKNSKANSENAKKRKKSGQPHNEEAKPDETGDGERKTQAIETKEGGPERKKPKRAKKATNPGTVKRRDRDKRLLKNRRSDGGSSPSIYDEPHLIRSPRGER